MSKLLNWLILLTLFAGIGLGLVRFQQVLGEFNRLNEVYEPLAGDIRTFEPGSRPNEFYVRCVVRRRMNLCWQFSIPPGKKFALVRQGIMDGGLQIFENPPARSVHSFEWAVSSDRRGRAYFRVGSSSTRTTGTYDDEVASFLTDHWDQLVITVAGDSEMEVFNVEQPATLLSIEIPAEVLAEASGTLSAYSVKQMEKPTVFYLADLDCGCWDSLQLGASANAMVERMR